jgi:mRNA interferase HigB
MWGFSMLLSHFGNSRLIPPWERDVATNVVSKKTLKVFWEKHQRAEIPLGAWYQIMSKGDWSSPAHLKVAFGNNVDFVGDNRAIFDIGGNKYRVIVHLSYRYKTALIKFVGTHEEYDKIDAETV